ncbi:Mut7-C RNAse domain-containing protein [Fervidobacterium islandicum]|uniref:Mut7-C RNAse domain-containing protein n=1 Tax=Fervidobacterium islandicum TaxID=2423 RepID=UPI003A61BD5D
MNKAEVRITIRFFGSLVDLVGDRYVKIDAGINQTIKDCIERLGVPHTEVYFITLRKDFVRFDRIVENGDTYFVYPECNLDIPKEYVLTPKYAGVPKFILDIHLGKLARLLRMLGISAEYGIVEDEMIVQKAVSENLIILTRDRGMLKKSEVVYGYVVRSDKPEEQLREVTLRYSLQRWFRPFTRCMECNGELISVSKSVILDQLPEKVKENYDEFAKCSKCGKVYWGGTHYENMNTFIEKFLENLSKGK